MTDRLFLSRDFECHDDDLVAYLKEVGAGAIHTNCTGTAFTFDNVCFQPIAISHIGNKYPFEWEHAACLQQIFIDCDAAYIVQIGLSNLSPMNF